MSYIITDDKHYKDIANSIRSKMQIDREYYPEDMALAIDNIPSSADGTDNPVISIYYTNPDDNGKPTKVKVSGWVNPTGGFPNIFTVANVKLFIKAVDFLNCNFAIIANDMFNGCSSLTTINFPSSLTSIGNSAFYNCKNLNELYLPNSLTFVDSTAFWECRAVHKLTFEQGFNLSFYFSWFSQNYTREQIVSWLNALADRTGQTANNLIMGETNLAKLTEEDILIATNKNWTLA